MILHSSRTDVLFVSSDVNSYEGCVEGTNIDRTSVKLWLHVAKYVDILANNEIGVNRVSDAYLFKTNCYVYKV